MSDAVNRLKSELSACRLCEARFAATATAHEPNPVVWFHSDARILVAGQAPGLRVHNSGKPFTDPSGDRLRDWMGLQESEFYDRNKVAIIPMAFCFPGYDAKGSDLPPPKICAQTWRERVSTSLGQIALTILVGAHAQKWHLGTARGVTETVFRWRDRAPGVFSLPHPSWRNSGWLKRHPWFEAELIPELQTRIREVLDD